MPHTSSNQIVSSARRRWRVCVLGPWLAGLALVAGCRDQPREQESSAAGTKEPDIWQTNAWPMTRGGKALQGRVRDKVPRQPVVAWTFAAKAAVTSEAAIANGLLVFGNEDGVVIAVDWQTHRERWRLATGDAVEATPAIASNMVFVGSNDGEFRALDLTTGRPLWQFKGPDKFPTGGVVTASPDGAAEWILVNGYDGVARCLRTKDGTEVWQYATGNYLNGSPVILDGGLVAFGGCDAVIHVIRLKDGTAVHKLTTAAQVVRSLAGWDTNVYGVNYANQLLAAGTMADNTSWIYEDDGAQFLTMPALDANLVYVGSRDKHLHAVNRTNGQPAWKFKTGGRVESAPLVFDDAVVFGSSDGRLYAVDKQTGREIWRLDLGEKLVMAPAFAAGRIVIGGGDGTMFVIEGGNQP